ncbi:MAG: sensor histidine kinase [Acidobacteriota bacterium]
MLNSVRIRLTLWHTGMLALILVVFSAGVYALISRRLYGELDNTLQSSLDVISASLNHEIEEHKGPVEGEKMFRTVLNTIHHSAFPRQAISVFSGARLVASKPGTAGVVLRAPRSPAGGQRVATRSIYIPLANTAYQIAIAEPVARTRAELAAVRGILIVAIPFALGLVAIVGYILARKSLSPVVAMSKHVERITAERLGERLTVANPRDELGRLAVTFNDLLQRLDQAFDQQRRFMADASHELRTPISVSRTAAEVTLDGPDRPAREYREALSVVAAQMQRLTRVVNDMFTLARADSGAYVLQRSSFYLNDVIEEALTAARLLAAPKRIALRSGPLTESPYFGDEDLIRQLILILLDNAIKYTPEGGTAEIRLEPGYSIVVADSGVGVPEEAREKIFDRFFRVDKARSRSSANSSGGAGLGLSIARWITGVHGGTATLRSSEPGRGSVFVVELPA